MTAPFELHLHTDFSDGRASPEEMLRAALSLGCPRIGFSDHAPMPYGDYAMAAEREEAYIAEITRLKQAYSERIEVLLGLEVDLWSLPVRREKYDYIIGSCHSLSPLFPFGRVDVDGPREELLTAIDSSFSGDAYAACEDYFASVARLGELRPDIIGHFDLIRKHNADGALFDEAHPRYLAAAKRAVDALLPLGVRFEVNTGAVSRGYRDTPYPAAPILSYILQSGGRVILTGDAHAPEQICYEFPRWQTYISTFQ